MFVNHAIALHALRVAYHHCVGAGNGVLLHREGNVAVRVAYGCLSRIQYYVELLELAVESAVGLRVGLRHYLHRLFRDAESRLEERLARVLLVVDLQEVVARNQRAQLFGGQLYAVVDEVDECVLREGIVLDGKVVEAGEIFRLHEAGGLPVGIAVQKAVTQEVAVFAEAVEVDGKRLVAAQ